METKFDSLKVQKPALEILLALSFNNNASFYLKENQNVMNYIRILSRNNIYGESTLQRAAAGLLWKLEKETEAVSKPVTLNSYKYDVMISYSHGDKRVCHQIHKQLVKDGFRVWIDLEHMHGSTMIAMADAIENSNVILMCMSDNYKQSVYCQSEAHYAFERRRRIIPLIVKSYYKPDGWLGIIVSGKLYVDFTKLEFNSAYEKLNNEIRQCCSQNTSQTKVDGTEKYQHNSSPTMNEVGSQSIAQYPTV